MNMLRSEVFPVLLAMTLAAACQGQLKIAGVSHVTLTVTNLSASTQFYTEILGGLLSIELSSLEPTASKEYVEMFTGEKTASEHRDHCGEEANCRNYSSEWKVSWASIVFDNMMVQLVEYTSLKEESQLPVDPPSSPMAGMMGTQLAFWLWDSVNLTEYARHVEEESRRKGFKQVNFMRPLLLSDTAGSRQASAGVRELRDEMLNGLSIGYATGPDGESLKFIQLINDSKTEFGKHYCHAKVTSSGLLDSYDVDRCGLFKNSPGAQLYGVNHISVTTMDINRALSFFVEELGGYLIEDIQPSNLQSPSLQKLLFKSNTPPGGMMSQTTESQVHQKAADVTKPASDFTTEAKTETKMNDFTESDTEVKIKFSTESGTEVNIKYSTESNIKKSLSESDKESDALKRPKRKSEFDDGENEEKPLGSSTDSPDSGAVNDKTKAQVVNLMAGVGLNMRYILLGNVKVEIKFLSGMDRMMGMLPTMMLSNNPPPKSFMKSGNADIALGFESAESLHKFTNKTNFNKQMRNEDDREVKEMEDGPLKGLKYSIISGPNKEVMRLVYYGGQSRRVLQKSMREYGAVHKMFDHLNPWNYQGYHTFCSDYN